ncbi:hypothetical protein CAEBREN_28072 [Caenorhabditis brenneri]|uniref:Uncharacterized protein n=1 Tax=Caenorhabditis brenneri TaxID=135651 RepID=G0PF27_CAEBE|nr:hypothetical protein CAEBREN_28072 [Caenorhabditis brenneri]
MVPDRKMGGVCFRRFFFGFCAPERVEKMCKSGAARASVRFSFLKTMPF